MHAFNVSDAKKYSIEKAILLFNLRFWLDKNKANGHNAKDGYYWTYNSAKAFCELFPYMKEKSIARWLKELEDIGVLMSSKNYNKHKYDKTKWYTIPSEYAISQNEKRISQDDISITQNDISISRNDTPIPYINTDVKTNKNTNVNSDKQFFSFFEAANAIEQGTNIPRHKVTEEDYIVLVKTYGCDADGNVKNLPF